MGASGPLFPSPTPSPAPLRQCRFLLAAGRPLSRLPIPRSPPQTVTSVYRAETRGRVALTAHLQHYAPVTSCCCCIMSADSKWRRPTQLPFLNRREELTRLRRLFTKRSQGLGVICGRRVDPCGRRRRPLRTEDRPAKFAIVCAAGSPMTFWSHRRESTPGQIYLRGNFIRIYFPT